MNTHHTSHHCKSSPHSISGRYCLTFVDEGTKAWELQRHIWDPTISHKQSDWVQLRTTLLWVLSSSIVWQGLKNDTFFGTFTMILNLPLSPQLYWTIECWVTLPQAQSRSAVNEGLIFRILDHSSIRFSLLAYTGKNMLSVWRRGSRGAVKLSAFVWIISETHFFLCHNINHGFLKVYLSCWLFSYFLRLYFFKSSFRFTAKLSRRYRFFILMLFSC